MRNARLAERQKELGLEIVESNNRTFIETMRGVARMLANKKGVISADDLREYYDNFRYAKQIPAPRHLNAWGAVFKTSEWEPVGYMKSEQVSRKGGVIRLWKLKTIINSRR